MQFLKRSVPQKLNLKDVWNIYKVMDEKIPDEDFGTLDSVSIVMGGITPMEFSYLMDIFYKRYKYKNPLELSMLFTLAIKNSNLFSFIEFIRKMLNGNPEQRNG